MRAMIQAAGLGTRLRPLTALRPKPALPIRGVPLVAATLAWLHREGVREVLVNLHHLAPVLRETVAREAPPGMRVEFSLEPEPLGTGGGLRRAREFLAGSDPCLVVAGDMLVEAPLAPLLALHRERGDSVTLVLREDPRAARFGTIGVDGAGRVRRIARRLDLGGEVGRGLYTSVRLVAARALATLPERDVFVDLDDWLGPQLAAGANDVRAVILGADEIVWEPVGTLPEYLAANLAPPPLAALDLDAEAHARGVRVEKDLVVGAGATIGAGAQLERVVVWDRERVPAGLHAHDGVFAGGRFHAAAPAREAEEAR